jgi:DNA-binding beta-propeller fold protein YncE
VRTITGLEHPQASLYIPGLDRIAVSSQSGKLRFYDAATYALIKTLDFGAGANTDNMRYDDASKRLYVAYGEREHAALATVDPITMERLEEVRLGSHPESFQLEQNGPRIFVNLPDQEGMAVIDRKSAAVIRWKIPGGGNNHALAFDEPHHRLFTASLQPGRLSVVDTQSGGVIASLPCTLGVDDLWLDASRNRVYAPGAGAVDIFQSDDATPLSALARVPAGAGAGSTSLHIRTRTQNSLYMSSPNTLPQGGSEILLFYVND